MSVGPWTPSERNRGLPAGGDELAHTSERHADINRSVTEGSTCLVKEQTSYFPAKLQRFVPAATEEEQRKARGDRYEVEDQIGKVRVVNRKRILFLIEEEIATCTVRGGARCCGC